VQGITAAGYATWGPQVRDGAVTLAPLEGAEALPRVRDTQGPGSYRLASSTGERLFDYACGPQALKPLLFAGHERLWEVSREANGLSFRAATPTVDRPLAVLGVRPCDLAALALHDAHFLKGEYRDAAYAARRAGLFLVAVNCSRPAATCFCASTGDGPAAGSGYDLLLDELDDGYLVHVGSEAGERVMREVRAARPTADQVQAAEAQRRAAVAAQMRRLPGRDLSKRFSTRLEDPHWQEVAARCLSCGNCTAVCPTCFCHAHVEQPRLDGQGSVHYRVWDSCFTENHSYIHGIVIRGDTAKRYRQWLTHKLGSWHEQYGRSGCVGCGRCITWCPAEIDFTAEAAAVAGGGA
jgi:ferredoxin